MGILTSFPTFISHSGSIMKKPIRKYHVVASDLDGTLLGPDHKLSEFAKSTLRALHQKGYTFVFATGRHHIEVAGIREMTGIPAYMVTSNGARVYDTRDELLFSRDVPPSIMQDIVDVMRQDPDIFIHIYRNDTWLLSHIDEALCACHDDAKFTFTEFDAKKAPVDGISKVFFTHKHLDHDLLASYEVKLKGDFGDKITVAFSNPWCLEVMGPEISKGHALRMVSESVGYSLKNCIAFGDGMNDLEMLSMAGKGVVMGTSHEKVLRALPAIERIGSSAEDAVPLYLETHLLQTL